MESEDTEALVFHKTAFTIVIGIPVSNCSRMPTLIHVHDGTRQSNSQIMFRCTQTNP